MAMLQLLPNKLRRMTFAEAEGAVRVATDVSRRQTVVACQCPEDISVSNHVSVYAYPLFKKKDNTALWESIMSDQPEVQANAAAPKAGLLWFLVPILAWTAS
jgi:hypothetical protein